MTHKTKLLILTIDAGFGHRRAAEALSEAVGKIYGEEVTCKVVNPLKDVGMSSVIQKTQTQYDKTSRDHRLLYQMVYNTSNKFPINLYADEVISDLMVQEIYNAIIEEKPDGIIATFPLFNTAVRRVIGLFNIQIPFYSVVTDLGDVHRSWFNSGPDLYFVASELLKNQAIVNRIPERKIVVSGIPVDPRIAEERRAKKTIRQNLGWEQNLPTVLAVGSRRVNNLMEKLQCLEESHIPFQLVVVAGGDEAFFKNLKMHTWKVPTQIYNYVNNIPEFMHASDILMTKAGGLVVSEGLACGLPMIIIDAISGQETGNVQFIQQNDAGIIVKTSEELKNTIESWLMNDGELLTHFEQNARRLGKPEAAYQIVRAMMNDIQVFKNKKKPAATWMINQLLIKEQSRYLIF